MLNFRALYTYCFLLVSVLIPVLTEAQPGLKGKIICIDPGHGGTAATDQYRVGPTGEREEWIDLRVGLLLRDMLQKKGATVLMTRVTDVQVPLMERAALATTNKADLFVSIHHNATADTTVNFPIIYFDGAASENKAGVALARALANALMQYFYRSKTVVSIVSDFTIFPKGGAAVLRGTYGIPGILAEASFFTNPGEEGRLKQDAHNRDEAVAYLAAIETFFKQPVPEIKEKKIPTLLPPFLVFEEAERMTPIAREWLKDYNEGMKLSKRSDTASLQQAYDYFTRSARSFPDSWVAGACHLQRSIILNKMDKREQSIVEKSRATEFYPR